MPADSWIAPDAVPALAAEATARIDEALNRLSESDRDAFWASVRKCYNTPYNDPTPRALPRAEGLTIGAPDILQEVSPASAPDPAQTGSPGLGAAVLAAALAAIPMPGAFAGEAQSA